MLKRFACMIVASCLLLGLVCITIPSVSADDSVPFFQTHWQYSTDGGTTWKNYGWASNSEGFVRDFYATNYTAWRMDAMMLYLGNNLDNEFWVQFNVTNICQGNLGTAPLLTQTGVSGQKQGIVTESYGSQNASNIADWYVLGVSGNKSYDVPFPDDPNHVYISTIPATMFVRIKLNRNASGNARTVFTFTAPPTFTAGNACNCLTPYILDSSYFINKNIYFDSKFQAVQNLIEITNTTLGTINTNVISINNGVTSIKNNLDNDFFDIQHRTMIAMPNGTFDQGIDSFSYAVTNSLYSLCKFTKRGIDTLFDTQHTYYRIEIDPDTLESSIVQETGSYWDALLGTLDSLNSDAQSQWYEQQKAVNAGAADALDEAWTEADVLDSFGSLSDLLGIGGVAPWDSLLAGSNASSAITSWFSDQCRRNIDAVPITRSDDGYISSYNAHINEILRLLGLGGEDGNGTDSTYFIGN